MLLLQQRNETFWGRLHYELKPLSFHLRAFPLYNAFFGTLVFEVNLTGWGYPCQKCFRGRSGGLVKFTFRGDPRQKAFWGRLLV